MSPVGDWLDAADCEALTGAVRVGSASRIDVTPLVNRWIRSSTLSSASPLAGSIVDEVSTAPPTPDYYKFEAVAGDRVTLALSSVTVGNVDVQLMGNDETTVLASGVTGAANLNEAIQDFAITSSGTYIARITGDGGVSYSLVVTKNSAFDIENNNSFATAQSLSTIGGALGAVEVSAGPTSLITFSELSQQSADGLSIKGVTFGYTVGGIPSTGATFGAPGAGTTLYTTDPELIANTTGILSLTFAIPTTSLQFGYLIASTVSVANAGTVQLFDASNNLIATRTISTSVPIGFTFSEALFSEISSTPIKSVRLIPNSVDTTVFVVDSIQFDNGTFNGEGDWYSYSAVAGESVYFQTRTPSASTDSFVNNLNPKIELYSPSNTLVATGVALTDGRNESIQYTSLVTGTYRIRVFGESNTTGEYYLSKSIGATAISQDTTSPKVTEIIAAGSAWSTAFIDTVDGGGVGAGNGLGYSLTQGLTIPNSGVDRIYVQFSEPVVGFDASSVQLFGVNIADYASIAAVSYDSANMRGVIELSNIISKDKLRIGISDAVIDRSSNALDGDANGSAGGILDFRFNVLVGDANGDGSVNGGDAPALAASFNKSVGNISYNPRADWNADGSVNGGDLPLFSTSFNQSLPIAEPGAMSFPLPPSLPEAEPDYAPPIDEEDIDAFFSQLDSSDELTTI